VPDPRPSVDVGIVTWNTREVTVDALRRLLAGDQGCDIRVLVHDNASSDGTAEAIRRELPAVDVVVGDRNGGFAYGVNRLLERSSAEWFFALNSDAWPEDGCLATLVRAAQRRPDAALVVPRIERPDGRLEHSTYPFPSVRVAAFTAFAGWRWLGVHRAGNLLLEGAWAHDEAREVDWAVGAAWLMRRSAVDAIGGLDERFFMYAEDVEWCWRARQHGWRVWFEPSALVRHVGNASGEKSYGRRRTAAYLRNTYRFYDAEHGPVARAAYRLLNVVGCARLYLLARWRHRPDQARFWADHLRVHLRPVRGNDGPPAAGGPA
jgi:N-acetylglucosaminyl-diphospho-decaprenol L-rhamnosyltransferase